MNPISQEAERVSGLILAGGRSSRFGEPKPLATLHGRSLVSWVALAIAPFCGELLVSIGAQADATGFRRAVPGARLVRDIQSDRGPIEGFSRGFRAAGRPIVLVVPSDAPLLRPSLLRALCRALGDHDAAVPRPGVMDPVRAVYRREAVLATIDAHSDVVRSPSSLVDRLDAVFLEGEDLTRADPIRASFIDVNRREDLALAASAQSVLG